MTDDQVCATVEKFGANSEECARLNASLSCLRSVHKSGESGTLVPAGRVPSSRSGSAALSRWGDARSVALMRQRRLQVFLSGLQSSCITGDWPGTGCPQGTSLLWCIPVAQECMEGSPLEEAMSC